MSVLPSTDLYFLTACEKHVARRWQVWRTSRPGSPTIRRLSANCFLAGTWMVLVRRDSQRIMREALAWPGKLAYVVDDDIAGAVTCENLPKAYRTRLATFDRDFHRLLLERADALLVPSETLSEIFRETRSIRAAIHHIDPIWREPFASQDHYAHLANGGTLRIVHLGSGSHTAALSEIAPAINRWLVDDPLTHFTYFAARPVLPVLEFHPRARRLEPKPWGEYRRWLVRQRFHLALYPLIPSRFDRARSTSKLIEHAIVGAVGVYPQDWMPARKLGAGGMAGALFAPAQPLLWGEMFSGISSARTTLALHAASAVRVLESDNSHQRQRDLWSAVLGMNIT